MSKHNIQITDEKLYNDIVEFCKLNNEKISSFCQKLIEKQFLIEKYGYTPFNNIEIITPIKDNNVDNESVPFKYELNDIVDTITNGPIDEKYLTKQVPKEYYGEIKTIEDKPKKRRL